jgi:PAS domain S-box-containing protein
MDVIRRLIQRFANSLHEPVLLLDDAFQVRVANPAFCRTFQFTADSVEGRYVYDLVVLDEEAQARFREALERLRHSNDENAPEELAVVECAIAGQAGVQIPARMDMQRFSCGQASPQIIVIFDVGPPSLNQATDALRHIEERLRHLTANMMDIFIETDVSGVIQYVTPSAQALLGYSPDALVGKSVFDYVHPDDREYALREFNDALRGRSQNQVEIRARGADGVYLWLEVIGRPLQHTGDQNVAGVLAAREISARKRVEQTLRRHDAILSAVGFAAERLLREASWQENLPAILEQLGLATAVSRVYVFHTYTGANSELLLRQSHEWVAPGITSQIDNPELQAVVPESVGFRRWAETLSRGDVICGAVRDFPEAEREVLEPQAIVSLVAVPVFVNNTWWGFIGFDECRNQREWLREEIEALKTAASIIGAAIQRQQAEDLLRESEERFARAFHASPAPMAIATIDEGRCLDINDSFLRLAGYSREEVIGRSAVEMGVWPTPGDRDRLIQMLREQGSVRNMESGVRTRQGELRSVLISAEIITLRGVDRLLTLTYDITDRKRAEQHALALALEREKIHLLENFINNTSHDLRTPLTVMTSSTYVLQHLIHRLVAQLDRIEAILADTTSFGDDMQVRAFREVRQVEASIAEHGERLQRGAIRMGRLIEGLHEMIRLDRRTAFDPAPADLNEVVREALEMEARSALERGVTIRFTPDPALPVVHLEKADFRRVVHNLVSNAIQNTPPDGLIEVSTGMEGGSIVFTVRDTGIGISESDLPHLFDLFYRADKARNADTGGAGLGLTIVKRIVELHGGRIEIESAPGAGSTFRVVLPTANVKMERKTSGLPLV